MLKGCKISVSLDVICDFLGHVDIKTTEIYVRANLEMNGSISLIDAFTV